MVKWIKTAMVAVALSCAIVLGGCSSSPSDEELRQLSDLRQEVSSLDRQVQDKQKEKAELDKNIADKNAKLKQCQSDQEEVKKGLGK